MTRIALLDGNDVEQSATACLVTPNTLDIGHAALLNLFPDERRFHHALGNGVIRWRATGSSTSKNGIITVVDVLHADDGLRPAGASVIAGPFTERPLVRRSLGSMKPSMTISA